jgi:hypothetical protein
VPRKNKHEPRFFLLNEDHSVREVELMEWAREFSSGRHDELRRIARTGNDNKWVSTVFLGLDHRHFGNDPPLIFETKAFVHRGRTCDFGYGPKPVPDELDCDRYSSWDDAVIGHKAMVRKYLVHPAKVTETACPSKPESSKTAKHGSDGDGTT